MRPYFRVAIDGTQMAKPKPFPDAYLRAAQLLAKTPAQCIVFEDSPAGVAAGVAANMRVVGVETTPSQFVGTALVVRDFLDPLLEPWISAQTSREERKY